MKSTHLCAPHDRVSQRRALMKSHLPRTSPLPRFVALTDKGSLIDRLVTILVIDSYIHP